MIAIAAAASAAQAQSDNDRTGPAPAIQWSQTYSMPGYGWAESLCPTSDGGYVISGMTYNNGLDAFLIKTSADGNMQWSNTYGGPYDDDGLSAIQAPDGGYVLAGAETVSQDNYTDILLVKTDANGQQEWSKTIGTTGPDWGRAVIAVDGGYLLAGFMYASDNSGYSGSDGYMLKISPDGKPFWSSDYIESGMYSEQFDAACVASDGNYVVAGTVGQLDQSLCLVKADSATGNQLWIKRYDDAGNVHDVHDVRQTTDGGFIIAGTIGSDEKMFLLRTDSDGNEIWYKEYDQFGRQFGGTVEQLPDGGFIAGGACLIRTDKDGSLLWAELTDAGFTSYATAVVANADGSYTVAGGTGNGRNSIAPILLRTMPDAIAAATSAPTAGPVVTLIAAPTTHPTAVPTARGSSSLESRIDWGWLAIAGLAVGIFLVGAGVLVILLLILLIVATRTRRPPKQ